MPVPKGSLGKYTPAKPSPQAYRTTVMALIVYSVAAGYMAAVEPVGEWRLFSWHPFLMVSGMVGFCGVSSVTKKRGGYKNTKLHGILGWLGVFMSFGGIYAIWKNKELNDRPHLASAHAIAGAGVMVSMVGLGMAGGVFLHPDFGIDKTNKNLRFLHKTFARLTLIVAYLTAIMGLFQLIPSDLGKMAMFSLPLVAFVPFVAM